MVHFFSREASNLHAVMSQFHVRILRLAKVYNWHEAILLMVIELHTHIIAKQPSDCEGRWQIRGSGPSGE